MIVTYTLQLTVTRAIDDAYDPDFTPQEHADCMVNAKSQRELEKEVLVCLRRLDGDCDVEVMDCKVGEDS
jgi:hypothetical protein